MASTSTALANDECGQGAAIICSGNAYNNGVAYTGTNIDLTLASGSEVDTSGGSPQVGDYSVGFGISTPWLVDSGNASVTVERGARIVVTQPQSAPLGFMGIAVRGSGGAGNSAVISNDGLVDLSGDGGRGVYAFVTGDIDLANGNDGTILSSGKGPGTYGIFAMSTDNGQVAVSNGGKVSSGGTGALISTGGTASLMNMGAIIGETGVTISGSAQSGNRVVNAGGDISGTNGPGLLATGAFDIVNENLGAISGTTGVVLQGDRGSLTNRATIIGTGGTAVSINGNNNALILDTGSVLDGNAISMGTGNALTLQGQGSNEGNIEGFSTIAMDGNAWLLAGEATTTSPTSAATDVQRGTLIVTGRLDNQGTNGGITIRNGATLQLGNGGDTGTATGSITDDGTLAFRHSDTVTYSDVIQGNGGLTQLGPGTLRLQGTQAYKGPTRVSGGVLEVDGVIQSDTSVDMGGVLSGSGVIEGDVTNRGALWPGEAIAGEAGTHTLTIRGNYVGQGGLLELNTYLGSDGSPSDVLRIEGGTASGHTGVVVHSVSPGTARPTSRNGILVISAADGAKTTPDAFSLASEVRAGALDYHLFRGSEDGTSEDNWYLRNVFEVAPDSPSFAPEPMMDSDVLPDTPPPTVLPPGDYPIIGPEIATYSAVQPMAQQMGRLSLGTFRQRAGDGEQAAVTTDTGHGPSTWARLYAANVANRYLSYTEPSATGNLSGLQIGADVWQGELLKGQRERWGGYLSYTNADINVRGLVTNDDATGYAIHSTGSINLHQTAAGVYWTHFGPNGWYLDYTMQASVYGGRARTAYARLPAKGVGFLGSLEYGQSFSIPQLGSSFVLEPQLQAIWQTVRFVDANDGLGDVSLGGSHGSTGRIGVRGRWSLVAGTHQLWQPYAVLNVWRDWGGRASTTYGSAERVPLVVQASRLEIGGGVTGRLGARFAVYGSLSYAMAVGDTTYTRRSSASAQVGVRYAW